MQEGRAGSWMHIVGYGVARGWHTPRDHVITGGGETTVEEEDIALGTHSLLYNFLQTYHWANLEFQLCVPNCDSKRFQGTGDTGVRLKGLRQCGRGHTRERMLS